MRKLPKPFGGKLKATTSGRLRYGSRLTGDLTAPRYGRKDWTDRTGRAGWGN
jgi:hypothetical protein